MIKIYKGIIAFAFLLVPASAANLVTNGDFSSDCSSWTTSNTDSFFCQSGIDVLGVGNPGGWADLNNGPNTQPEMSQTILGLVMGATYQLTWDMQSAHKCCGSSEIAGAGVTIDGNTYEFIVPDTQGWTPYRQTFTYTGVSNVLTFSSQRNGTDTDAGFDNISIEQVGANTPEPSTMTLLGGGLAFCGLSLVRKLRRK